MRTLVILLVALGVLGASPPPKLMGWGDLLAKPMPQPTARIAYGPGENQFAELWVPDGPGRHPVVLMIHGGCWRARIAKLNIMNFAAEDLRRRGFAVWNLEYRGADQAGGGYPGTFQDVAAGADALRGAAARYGLDLRRVVAVGHSAGGHLAAWLAARRRLPAGSVLVSPDPLPIAAVVNIGGLPDLKADKAAAGDAACGSAIVEALVGAPSGERPDVWADTSPAERLPLRVTQVVMNGSEATTAPPWLGRAYAARARKAGERMTFTVIQGAGHVELIAPGTDAWSREAAVIARLAR